MQANQFFSANYESGSITFEIKAVAGNYVVAEGAIEFSRLELLANLESIEQFIVYKTELLLDSNDDGIESKIHFTIDKNDVLSIKISHFCESYAEWHDEICYYINGDADFADFIFKLAEFVESVKANEEADFMHE